MSESQPAPIDRAEFDRFADEYARLHASSISASGEGPDFFARYKVKDVLEAETRRGAHPRRILDFGAGVGSSVPFWNAMFPDASLVCLDVSERSLEIGRERFGALAEFREFDGRTIPYPAASFDVVFAACVFHHIDGSSHVPLLRELHRILSPGGCCYVFEHNPLNPLTRDAVNRCAFDENAVLIRAGAMRNELQAAGFRDLEVAYRIFFPHALRALRPLERALTWLPLGAQYCASGRRA